MQNFLTSSHYSFQGIISSAIQKIVRIATFCHLHITVYRKACAIADPDTDTVVVTGGLFNDVSRYGKEGWIEDFSSKLITGRRDHGCSSFLSKDNERVILVTSIV